MNFAFSPAEEAFRAEVRAFLEENVDERVLGELHHGYYAGPHAKAFWRKLAEKGWLRLSWPEEYGGTPGSMMYQYVLATELARAGGLAVGNSIAIAAPVLFHFASERLKAELLPRIARGEVEFTLGYTEPEVGSDLAALQTRAVRAGDAYVVNGQKRFTSQAHFADYIWLAARTDPNAPKHRGISLFVVDIDTPGITVRPLWTLGGGRTNEVYFEDVRVPAYRRVGEENRGWYYIAQALDLERVGLQSQPAKLEKEIERLVAWANREKNDRQPRAEPRVRARLARLAIRLEVSRLLELVVVDKARKGEVANVEAAMLKLQSTHFEQDLGQQAFDLLGLYGQLAPGSQHAPYDGRFENACEYSVLWTIPGGSSEIQKNVIAKRGLELPG
jgi:alkylation response protein AidB-like acyl-CoA dehydrogenase